MYQIILEPKQLSMYLEKSTMPMFEFEGRSAAGQSISGKRPANSADLLSAELLKEGITPIRISETAAQTNALDSIRRLFRRKIKTEELSMFARQMHTLMKAGVPITTAIKQLGETARAPRITEVLQGVVRTLESGQDLASAFQRYPDVFSPLMVSMIRIGQNAGRLDEAFLRLNQYLELEGNTMKQAKAALRYPLFVLITVVVAIVIVNIFVIPTFGRIFARANVPLPTITVILVTISNVFINHWLFLLIAVLVIGIASFKYLNTAKGKLQWHTLLLKLPILGNILQRIILMRFAQTFAITVNSGISITDGLALVGESIDNLYARQAIIAMQNAIQRGNSLTQAASASFLFTSLELQMLSVSEQTGALGEMLEQIAVFYQREVNYDLKRLNDMIEPLLIVILSVMVLILALAIYLPIWNMMQIVRKQ